jgi:outer membrane protein TolC
VAALSLSMLAGSARAEAPRPLSLEDAIGLAVRGNPALAAAGADLLIAEAAVEAARGLDDFVIDAGGRWHQDRREPVAGTPVQQPAVDGVSASLGVTRPLPTGGRLGLHLGGDYSLTRFTTELDMTGATARSTSEAWAPAVQLRLDHPLLRGLGISVARADRWRARAAVDVATANRQGTAAALLRDLIESYWDLSYATRELEIRRRAAASARDQLVRVQANIGVGKQPRSATAEIEVAIALRDDALLSSELVLTDRALELARLCALPIRANGGPMVVAADKPAPPTRSPDGAVTLERALARNPALLAARAQGRAAIVEVDVTENGMLPQLDLTVAGGPVGNAHDASGAYQQLTGLKSYSVMAQLLFQQPIGRHAARGARNAAREGLRKAHLAEEDIAAQISTAVVRGVAAVDTARRRAEVLARSTEAAALDLEAEKARFEVGRSTNFDVLRRQDALASVQLVLLRAQVDQLKALAAVDATTGDIFDRPGGALR